MTASETGHVTGTADKDYNLIWFTEKCLNNALRLQTYVQDAERQGRPVALPHQSGKRSCRGATGEAH